MKVAVSGGAATPLATGLYNPWGLAVDSTSVYWTNNDSVMKVRLSGGSTQTLASTPGQHYGRGIAVNATSVYWTAPALDLSPVAGAVMKAPLGGGAPVTISSEEQNPVLIALDATNVYWINNGSGNGAKDGEVRTVPLAGGQPVTLISGQGGPSGLALDATNIYWSNGSDNADCALLRAPK